MGRRLYMGGSFDPFHLGHLGMLMAVREAFGDPVVLVPAYVSPHKSACQASVEDRIGMLERATSHLDWVTVSMWELDQMRPVPTIETAVFFNELNPGDDVYFVLGSDSYFGLHTWHDYGSLIEQVQFIVVGREDLQSEEVLAYYEEYLSAVSYDRFHFLDVEPVQVSATEIRDRIRTGHSVSELVPKTVEAYIKEHRIYE